MPLKTDRMYADEIFVGNTADQYLPTLTKARAPTAADIHPAGTRWLNSQTGSFYTTAGAGVWYPGSGSQPPANTDFIAPSAIFRVRASGATAATVTVTGFIGVTPTVLGTLVVPAGGAALDFFSNESDAYQWSSTAGDTTVEII